MSLTCNTSNIDNESSKQEDVNLCDEGKPKRRKYLEPISSDGEGGTVQSQIHDHIRFVFDGDYSNQITPPFVHQFFGPEEVFTWPDNCHLPVFYVDVNTSTFGVQISIGEKGKESSDQRITIEEILCKMEKCHQNSYYTDLFISSLIEVLDKMRIATFNELEIKPSISKEKITSSNFLEEPNNINKIHNNSFLLYKEKIQESQRNLLSSLVSKEDVRFLTLDITEHSIELWRRIEWLMVWFIETSGSIDIRFNERTERERISLKVRSEESLQYSTEYKRPSWNLYLLTKDSNRKDNNNYNNILGFASVIHFPDIIQKGTKKSRVAQFMILPHVQHMGLGTQLLLSVHETMCYPRTGNFEPIRKLSMEEPNEEMNNLRDVVALSILLFRDKEGEIIGTWKSLETEIKSISSKAISVFLLIPLSHAQRLKCLLQILNILKSHISDIQCETVVTVGNGTREFKNTEKDTEIAMWYKKITELDTNTDSLKNIMLLLSQSNDLRNRRKEFENSLLEFGDDVIPQSESQVLEECTENCSEDQIFSNWELFLRVKFLCLRKALTLYDTLVSGSCELISE